MASEVGIGLAALALAIGFVYFLIKRQRSQPSRAGSSPGSNG